jgi:hypothetical protein
MSHWWEQLGLKGLYRGWASVLGIHEKSKRQGTLCLLMGLER